MLHDKKWILPQLARKWAITYKLLKPNHGHDAERLDAILFGTESWAVPTVAEHNVWMDTGIEILDYNLIRLECTLKCGFTFAWSILRTLPNFVVGIIVVRSPPVLCIRNATCLVVIVNCLQAGREVVSLNEDRREEDQKSDELHYGSHAASGCI